MLFRSLFRWGSATQTIFLFVPTRLCIATYEQAIELIGSARMWQLYVETLLELYSNDMIRPKIQLRLNRVCEDALTKNKLAESHIIAWVGFLSSVKR